MPRSVAKQNGPHSCGFYALASAVRLKDPGAGITGEMMQTRSQEISQRAVPRVGDHEMNSVLSSAWQNYKVSVPSKDGKPLGLLEALRSQGANGVFVAKAKADIRRKKVGESAATSEEDYHTVVITDYVQNAADPNEDKWTVLCSAKGTEETITAKCLTYRMDTVNTQTGETTERGLTIQKCQVFEAAAAPGGRNEPASETSFFDKMLSWCCCTASGGDRDD